MYTAQNDPESRDGFPWIFQTTELFIYDEIHVGSVLFDHSIVKNISRYAPDFYKNLQRYLRILRVLVQ